MKDRSPRRAETPELSERPREKLRAASVRAPLAGALVVALAAGAVTVALLTASPSPSRASSGGGARSPGGTVTVQRRDLVQTDTEPGTLSYADPQTVYDRLSGTVTWLPNVGQTIRRGQTLFRVDDAPVILMYGSTPAYRDLDSSDPAGPDIAELNRNLVALGYAAYGIVEDDVWQAGTTEAVDALQQSLGETETGSLTLGQVVFLPGAQLVNTVEGTVGSTGGGSGNTGAGSTASYTGDPPAPEFVSYDPGGAKPGSGSTTSASPPTTTMPTATTTTSTTTTTTTMPTTTPTTSTTTTPPARTPTKSGKPPHGHSTTVASLEALIAKLEREILALSAHRSGSPSGSGAPPKSGSSSPKGSSPSGGGASPSGGGASPGGSGTSATPILQTSSTNLVVTVELPASVQSEAVLGAHVTVEMPAGNTVGGKITAVSPVAQSPSSSGSGASGAGSGGGGGSGSSATIPVTVALMGKHAGAGLDQASVSVNFAQARANNVLSVPVTALLATPGGGYAVQEAAPPHKLIRVTTGLFAAGDVQISGAGIYQGLQVTASQG